MVKLWPGRRSSVAAAGVKDLKDHLSEYLRRAEAGERIVITDRGKPLAMLSPVDEDDDVRFAWELVKQGKASWSGGKPQFDQPVKLRGKGKTAAEMVLEDRQ